MFESIEHHKCIHLLNYSVPTFITFALGILSILIWICWDDWRMKKEDEAFEKSQLIPQPLDVEEIPRKNLYFQKLAMQIYENNIHIGETIFDKLKEVLDWMVKHEHKNAEDIQKIINLMNEHELTPHEYKQIYLWLFTGFRIWSTDPTWIMPSWELTLIQRTRSWTVS